MLKHLVRGKITGLNVAIGNLIKAKLNGKGNGSMPGIIALNVKPVFLKPI
jgi:hypothetical protein